MVHDILHLPIILFDANECHTDRLPMSDCVSKGNNAINRIFSLIDQESLYTVPPLRLKHTKDVLKALGIYIGESSPTRLDETKDRWSSVPSRML